MSSLKSRFSVLFSSMLGSFGGACGVAVCLAGGCCGSSALFGLIGLSSSTLAIFDKLTPLFLVLTIVSLSHAFYKAYKPKPENCCGTANDKSGDPCCAKEKKLTFFQSKSFLWITTILAVIMWTYTYVSKINNNNSNCAPSEQIINFAPKIDSAPN